jgi:DNA processing protein
LQSLPAFSPALAAALREVPPEAGERVLEEAKRLGARVLLSPEPEYPDLLRSIPDPPPVLFALGDVSLLRRPAVAIVGSRDHTPYGAEVCRALAGEVARAGAVVVSGMARGLDAVAHQAALDSGGGTVGVLGNGLGVIYPAANRGLYDRVASHGLLLTEFAPGERPHAGSFPRRNRLISGLARVIVVVEAAAGSGALITAGCALEQGREVMAVPGPITSPTSAGANGLVRDGAAPYLEPADLLRHYPELTASRAAPAEPLLRRRALPDGLSGGERELAELLGDRPTHLDELASRAGRPIPEVLALLSGLEIAGLVEQQPGRMFRRA